MPWSPQGTYPHLANQIFFNKNIRMGMKKIFVIESDVANNAKPIGYNAEFIGVAEMSVDVHLLDGLMGSGMCRHRTVSSFIRIVVLIEVICFCKSF